MKAGAGVRAEAIIDATEGPKHRKPEGATERLPWRLNFARKQYYCAGFERKRNGRRAGVTGILATRDIDDSRQQARRQAEISAFLRRSGGEQSARGENL